MRQAGSKALGGLSAAGNLIDMPASMVRDVLAGENPLDQLLTPLRSENRVTGRDLLRRYGLSGRRDTYGNFAAGLGAEIALDPLTYLTFGASALTKAGQVAKAAGLLNRATEIGKATGRAIGPRSARASTTLGELITTPKIEGTFPLGATSDIAARRAVERVARRQGLPLDQVLGERLGGPLGIGLPFARPTTVVGRQGGVLEKLFSRAPDIAGGALAASAPGRFMRMVFDPPVRNQLTRAGQELGVKVTRQQQAARPAARTEFFDISDRLTAARQAFTESFGEAIETAGDDSVQLFSRLARHIGERGSVDEAIDLTVTRQADDLFEQSQRLRRTGDDDLISQADELAEQAQSYRDLATRLQQEPGALAKTQEIVGRLKDTNRRIYDEIIDMGGGNKYLDEPGLEHIPRYVDISRTTFLERQQIQRALQREASMQNVPVSKLSRATVERVTNEVVPKRAGLLAGTKTAVDFARTKETAGIPTEVANQMLVDPSIRVSPGSAEGQVQAASYILDNYTEFLSPQYQGRGEARAKFDFVNWLRRNEGASSQRILQQAEKLRTPEARNAIEQHAWELAQHIRSHPRRERYVRDLAADELRYLEAAYQKRAHMLAIHGFLAESASEAGAVPLGQVFQNAGMDSGKALQHFASRNGMTVEQAAAMAVPDDVAAAVKATLAPHQSNEWAQALGETIDKVWGWYRGSLTLPFPSFHGRNLASGQYINLTSEHINPGSAKDLSDYTSAVQTARQLVKKKNLDDPTMRELMTHEVIDIPTGEAGFFKRGFEDVSPAEARALPEWMQRIPGLRETGRGYQKLIEVGGKAMERVEFYNRVPMYLYLRKRGYEPFEAALQVKKLHFDYGELTQIEKNVLRRIPTFYTFTKKMAPLMFETLVQRPGGAMAQTLRAAARARGETEQPIPDYLEETAAVPLRTGAEGELHFLSGFGLPMEDVLGFFPSPLQEGLSRLAPPMKAAVEMGTGRSLFQRGRPLEDLDPGVGRMMQNVRQLLGAPPETGRADPVLGSQNLEFALSNLPTSRFITTGRTLTDPRKTLAERAVNFLSGVKTTTVSPSVQEAVAKERMFELMKGLGGRQFTKFFIPRDELDKLSPDERRRGEAFNAMMAEFARRSKQRRELAQR